MSDYIGQKLGNYRILRMIGRGGFATVYLGEHIYLKTPAAIKVLNMQLANNGLDKFLAEARTIALLEHPQIVHVLEFGIEGITPFLVMNYAEYGTIREHYPRNIPLSHATIISYTSQIAEALQYAHDCGVIHRDVKPENILLGKNHRIQLSDFGLALLIQNMQEHPSGGAGTTAYMAPEQLQGHPCPASDQYALGVVLYEWLSGTLPFTGSEREVTLQHLFTSPPALYTKIADLPSAVERVIMKALAKNPQGRFESIHEFAQAFEQAFVADKGYLISFRHLSPIAENPLPQVDALSSEKISPQLLPWEERIRASASFTFLPQLPLVLHGSPYHPTNEGRILQPSLGSLIYSLDGPSTFFASSSENTADLPTVSAPPLPPHTPRPQNFSNIVAPLLPQMQSPPLQKLTISRYSPLTALVGMAIIGLTILAGIFIWAQFAPYTSKFSSLQHKNSSAVVHINTPTSAKALHAGNLSPNSQHPTKLMLTPSSQVSPRPVIAPQPTAQPISISTAPLTIAITNAPSSAVAGSTITIVTQASKGNVIVALDGKVRFFGQKIATSQGVATFSITVPRLGKRIRLTATATDTKGVQVQSPSVFITTRR